MENLFFAANKSLYLTLLLSILPVGISTIIGLVVGLFQTVTQLQEQTLPFGLKLIGIFLCFFLLSSWYSEVLLSFSKEILFFALT